MKKLVLAALLGLFTLSFVSRSLADEPAASDAPVPLGFETTVEAEAHFRKALELIDHPRGLTSEGERVVREEFTKGLELDPENLQARVMWARVLLRLREDQKAQELIDGLVADHPDDVALRRSRGMVSLTELARYDVAEEDYLWVTEHTEPTSEDWTALGLARYHQGEYFSAKVAFNKALEQSPENIYARNNLGWVALGEERYAEAEEHFGKVLESAPDYEGALFGLAKAHEEQGNLGGAIDQYGRLIELSPNFIYFLDLLILYFKHYAVIFYVLGAVVLGLFVRTWIKTVQRDKRREAEAAKYR